MIKKNDWQFNNYSRFIFEDFEKQPSSSENLPKKSELSPQDLRAIEGKYVELKTILTPELKAKLEKKGTDPTTAINELEQVDKNYQQRMDELNQHLDKIAQVDHTQESSLENQQAFKKIQFYLEQINSPYNAAKNGSEIISESLRGQVYGAMFSQTVNSLKQSMNLMKNYIKEEEQQGKQIKLQNILDPTGMKTLITQAETYQQLSDQTKIKPEDQRILDEIKEQMPPETNQVKQTEIASFTAENTNVAEND